MDIYYQFFTDHHQKKIGISFKYNQEKIAIARSLAAAWSNNAGTYLVVMRNCRN